ncbi:MAG: ANTAR domain-containing protein [candidate division NC10 bacterium]|nr:ANTAR domain-containing protein [candidate division NC10 bacterium]
MSYRLLVIEDSPSTRTFLQEMLRGLGYAVVGEAIDAEEGLHLAQSLQPDLIFLAVDLKETNGLTVATRIMNKTPTPIILLGRHRNAVTIRRATQAGVMAYLIKPVRGHELVPAIELAIARVRELMALWKDNQHLRRALEGRKRIERAKGLLMARQGITEAEAFHSIQRQSMKTRTPMEQVAEAILVAEAVEEVVRPRSKNTQERLLTIKGGNQPTSL